MKLRIEERRLACTRRCRWSPPCPVLAAPPVVRARGAGRSPPRRRRRPPPAAEPDEGTELAIVKSPIVGTFYRAAEPGAKPFATVGDS